MTIQNIKIKEVGEIQNLNKKPFYDIQNGKK